MASRPFLNHFPERQWGHICNLFLAPIRTNGLTTPEAIVQAVSREVARRGANALKWNQPAQYAKVLMLQETLQASPEEAHALAAWAITWEAMPPSEKHDLKAQRAQVYQRRYMASQGPTERQLAYLTSLGYHGPIESRLHASQLIDEHLKPEREVAYE